MSDPIDTEALRGRALGQLGKPQVDPRWPGLVLALIDLIADTKARAEAAEHRAARAEAQADIRGRAVAIYRQRTQEAEAALLHERMRIRSVRRTLADPSMGSWTPFADVYRAIRRALDE